MAPTDTDQIWFHTPGINLWFGPYPPDDIGYQRDRLERIVGHRLEEHPDTIFVRKRVERSKLAAEEDS